jgi:hypothetical protein
MQALKKASKSDGNVPSNESDVYQLAAWGKFSMSHGQKKTHEQETHGLELKLGSHTKWNISHTRFFKKGPPT